MARRPQNRERRHVRAEEREEKYGRAERPAREKIVFCISRSAAAERKDADVQDRDQVSEDDRDNHGASRRGPGPSSRCVGQKVRTSHQSITESPRVYTTW